MGRRWPSNTISACAGIGRPVSGPGWTSIGAPLMAPANSYSDCPAGKYSKPATKGGGLDHGGRARLQRLALLHPGLERVERPQSRVDAERERGPLRAGGGVGE